MKKNINKKKRKKHFNINQTSFYFEDYLETNNKIQKKSNISQDRIYLLFFLFLSLIFIFSIRIIHVSMNKIEIFNQTNPYDQFSLERRDIVDRNGVLISRNINFFHAAIIPKYVANKENFLIKLRLNFPQLPIEKINKKFKEGKYFYLKKRISQTEKEKLWKLGEKGIVFEPFQSRIYTHANLYSHLIGQVDYDNYGVSGVEKFFDKELKDKRHKDTPLRLTLDTNLQYLIDKELNQSLDIFKATGGAALLMNVENGEILSLVSLPNFDINERADIREKKYINKITKGVYELGSIFKTFTIALALDNNIIKPETIIKDIPQTVKCSKHKINITHIPVTNITIKVSTALKCSRHTIRFC